MPSRRWGPSVGLLLTERQDITRRHPLPIQSHALSRHPPPPPGLTVLVGEFLAVEAELEEGGARRQLLPTHHHPAVPRPVPVPGLPRRRQRALPPPAQRLREKAKEEKDDGG